VATDFDEKAQTWDEDPTRVARARAAADAVRKAVALEPSTRLLEYGAGTGLVAQFLAGEVGPITLADPSAGMRDVMAKKVQAGELPPGTRIWDLDLATSAPPADRCDLIVTVMTLHHIHEIDPVLRGFATLLSDGGDLCVVDLDEEDGSFHDDPDFDGHHGISRATLTAALHAAGFRGVRFTQCYEIEKEGRTFPLFLARCHIPPP
jgi:ubiquinone/menaquinone biosynthesis C-methylase UbiE